MCGRRGTWASRSPWVPKLSIFKRCVPCVWACSPPAVAGWPRISSSTPSPIMDCYGVCTTGVCRMSREQGTLYIGTSGWAHRDWVGVLYAHDLSPSDYLSTYSQQFNTVEIEHTF